MVQERARTLAQVLDQMTVEGELYNRLPDGKVLCYACGHRCTIFPGKRGICKVRFNETGVLKVPWGYVGALQCDPTEKKPFNHVLPGSLTLTFGMLGCDFHCPYCFTGDTMVVTDRGPVALAEAFRGAERVEGTHSAEVAYPADLRAVAGSGNLRKVRAIFKHHYRGQLVAIRPFYLPELRCTPDHRIYATTEVGRAPEPIEARQLTTHHYLAIPRGYALPSVHRRQTTLGVDSNKASAAVLFQALAGSRSSQKRVPDAIFGAPAQVAHAFLGAYVDGDGHRYRGGKIASTTVSRDLAHGIAWLALRLGYVPSLYSTSMSARGIVLGREVHREPYQYVVIWYEDPECKRKVVETRDHHLIPVREVCSVDYEGDVYNMEVEEEHNYLAGFFLVSNCQNHITSQALRDPAAGVEPVPVTPEQMVQLAGRHGARLIGSSYNEPLITSEWAAAIFAEARRSRLKTCYISNGNATPEVLRYLRPLTDCYKIDLKAFNDRNYRFLGGTLESVTRSIKMVHEMGFWIEVVTLVIPGYNDSDEELRAAAEFLASVSPLIPWHVTAFHKDYKMTDPDNTPPETLVRAARIGEEAGLKYVYAGNLPGRVGKYEHTFCHACGALLVERFGYRILRNRLGSTGGRCPECGMMIPGIWE